MIDTKKIKQDFPILGRKINGTTLAYLDNAATTQKPKAVINAIVDYYENHNANVARGVHTLAEEATKLYEEARKTVAEFIGADPKEVVMVRNSTEAMNLVAFSYGTEKLAEGDVIVTSVLEHHSNMLPWRMVAEKTGAKLVYVEVDENGVMKIEDLKKLVNEQVKLVALSAKSNVTGAIQPVEEIIRIVRKKSSAKILIDGSHLVPHMGVSVKKLGADFLAFSGHKMLGPMGTGVLWGRRELLSEMAPFLRGGDMISEVTMEGQEWQELPHKFEAGTPDVAGAVGLAAAVTYLNRVGMENIYQHELELTRYALSELTKLSQKLPLRILGPTKAEKRVGVVTFMVDQVHAHDVAQILDNVGVAVRSGQHCAGPLAIRLKASASVRASFYLYNTKDEVDRMIIGLLKVKQVFGG